MSNATDTSPPVFDDLYRRNYPRIRAFFASRGIPRGEADDLVQETFLSAYRSLEQFRGESRPERWLLAIALNTLRNHQRYRSARKRLAPVVSLDEMGEWQKSGLPAEEAADTDLFLLREALRSLQPDALRVVTMRSSGYTQAEIASFLDVKPRHVRTILRRAMRQLLGVPPQSKTLRLDPLTSGIGSGFDQTPVIPGIIQVCDRELIRWMAKHPEDLYRVHPGTFERIVAEIFTAEGFDVELLSSWNQPDGGVDLLAVQRLGAEIEIRLAIQCKRYSQSSHVNAEPIRALSGVLDRFRAHGGVLVTTSYFTVDATEEARRHLWRISLQDFVSVAGALQRIGGYRLSKGAIWVPTEG